MELNKRNKVGEQFAVDPGKRGAGSGFLGQDRGGQKSGTCGGVRG